MAKRNTSPLLILFLVVFIDLVGFGIVIPILPYYASQYGANATVLGWLMAVYSGLQFFFAPVWGRLSDRIGRRPVLLSTMLGTIVSLLVLARADSLVWIFLGRALAGLCGANISTATAYIADVTTEENRTKGMGMIGAAFGLGFIFGPAIGGVLSKYGYQYPMYFAASLSALNWIFALAKLPEPAITKEVREKNRTKRFDMKAIQETLGDQKTRMATLSFFVITLAITQMEVVFALYMMNRFGFDAQGSGWLLAYMGIIMVLIQGGLIGKLSKKFGESNLILIGTLLMAIGLVSFSFSRSIGFVFLSLALLALGNGVTNPSLSSLASKGALLERRGATMGVYQSAGSLARVFGPLTAGFLYDRVGIQIPFLAAAILNVFVFAQNVFFKLTGGKMTGWISDARKVFKKNGWRGLVQTYGWKLMLCFFLYYLIRDVTIYIVVPYLIARGLIWFRPGFKSFL